MLKLLNSGYSAFWPWTSLGNVENVSRAPDLSWGAISLSYSYGEDASTFRARHSSPDTFVRPMAA